MSEREYHHARRTQAQPVPRGERRWVLSQSSHGRVLVTGASGFIGRQLVKRLLVGPLPAGLEFAELVLLDLSFDEPPADTRVTMIAGSIADEATLRAAFATPFDIIFHLVSIAGGLAEQNFDLGRQVNLNATMLLLELARSASAPPVLVYSSSIGVYGELPTQVNDQTPALPDWSYGTHKLIGELLMTDYSRKGFVDARSLRFPGIVARPRAPSGALSAFLSDMIHALAAGERFTCPTTPEAYSWWMSVRSCVENVVHAATLQVTDAGSRRVWTLPPLRASIGEVVAALGRVYGTPVNDLISYEPVPQIEERFGRLPPACFTISEAAGFCHDGSVDAMVRNALV